MDFKVALQLLLGLFVFLVVILTLSVLDREHAEGCAFTDKFFLPAHGELNQTVRQLNTRPVTVASEALDALVSLSGYFLYRDKQADYFTYLPLELRLVTLNDILDQKLLTLSTFCAKIALTIRRDLSDNRRKVDSIHVKFALTHAEHKVCYIQPEAGELSSGLAAHFACNRKLKFDCKLAADGSSGNSAGESMGELVFETLEFQVDDLDKDRASWLEFTTPRELCAT